MTKKPQVSEKSDKGNGKVPQFLLGLFQLLFDTEIMQMMADYTITYAQQKGAHTFSVISEEMTGCLGILLAPSCVVMPSRKIYWEQVEDVKIDGISTAMSRNRFEEILQYLHFSDNTKLAVGDKFAKVRPLLVQLNERFLLYNLAIY